MNLRELIGDRLPKKRDESNLNEYLQSVAYNNCLAEVRKVLEGLVVDEGKIIRIMFEEYHMTMASHIAHAMATSKDLIKEKE